MHFAVFFVAVEGGAEGLGNLPGFSAEDDPALATSGALDVEAFGTQPVGDEFNVGIRHPEMIAKFFGRQPVAIIRRSRIPLGGKKAIERRLLGRRRAEMHG